MKKLFCLLISSGVLAISSLTAAYGSSSGSSSQALPAFPKPSEPKKPAKPSVKGTPLPKTEQPVMEKPFGMPGVIGIVNDRWVNSDYLGFLEANFPITVELVLGKNIPHIDSANVENALADVLKSDNITMDADQTNGPTLPFLHLLIMVYPVDKNTYAIFAALRLFESVTVNRLKFQPAGYWQAVTWENQDMIIASSDQLQAQIKALATKLGTSFIKRYDEYNKERPKKPEPIKVT